MVFSLFIVSVFNFSVFSKISLFIVSVFKLLSEFSFKLFEISSDFMLKLSFVLFSPFINSLRISSLTDTKSSFVNSLLFSLIINDDVRFLGSS